MTAILFFYIISRYPVGVYFINGGKIMKRKSHMKWSWIIMVFFLTLGIIDFRFGILGFLCMGAPIYHVLRGRGKVHCSHYCPRGSILGKLLSGISQNHRMPKFMKTQRFKNALLIFMLMVFSFSLYHSGGEFKKVAFSVFRFMVMSLSVGVLMGILFKPRSWCTVCPMGHGTLLIKKVQDSRK